MFGVSSNFYNFGHAPLAFTNLNVSSMKLLRRFFCLNVDKNITKKLQIFLNMFLERKCPKVIFTLRIFSGLHVEFYVLEKHRITSLQFLQQGSIQVEIFS